MFPNLPPEPRAAKRRKNARVVWLVLAAVVVFLFGLAAGSGSRTSSPGPAAAEPAPTVTVTAAPVTKTVDATPKACLDALAASDAAMTDMADAFQLAGDGFGAVGRLDPVGVNAANAKLAALKPTMESHLTHYAAARDLCRAAK